MKEQNISRATIDRLPLYFRTLRLAQDEGIDIISSETLGNRLNITPEQIRKDLTSFGQFGKKGVGYYVNELKRCIGDILGLNNHWNIDDTTLVFNPVTSIDSGVVDFFVSSVAEFVVDCC